MIHRYIVIVLFFGFFGQSAQSANLFDSIIDIFKEESPSVDYYQEALDLIKNNSENDIPEKNENGPNIEPIVEPIEEILSQDDAQSKIQHITPVLLSVQEPEDCVTMNASQGTVVFRDYFCEPNSEIRLTINNDNVCTYSGLSLSVITFGKSRAAMEINDLTIEKGKIIVSLVNEGPERLDGNIWVEFQVTN